MHANDEMRCMMARTMRGRHQIPVSKCRFWCAEEEVILFLFWYSFSLQERRYALQAEDLVRNRGSSSGIRPIQREERERGEKREGGREEGHVGLNLTFVLVGKHRWVRL